MVVRPANKFHCQRQVVLVVCNERDVTFFRRPAMRAGFAFGQHSRLIRFCQSDVAMTVTMNVHEHGASYEKRVFMNSSVLTLGHAGQTENPLPQFSMKIVSWF